MSAIATSHPELLEAGPSQIEGLVPALFISPKAYTTNHACYPRAPREVFHTHEVDGSAHTILSAKDAALVIERGWGERHGLSGRALGFPLTYTMIYAPRDEHDIDTVCKIAKAAARYGLEGKPLA